LRFVMLAARFLLLSILSLVAVSTTRAELAFSNLFSDDMVLQCDMPITVWGQAAPQAAVHVTFRDRSRKTTSDGAGNWQVTFAPLKASTPADLAVVAGDDRRVFKRVVVGEVWLAIGGPNIHLYNTEHSTLVHPEYSPDSVPEYVRIHRPFAAPSLSGWKRFSGSEKAYFSDSFLLFGRQLSQDRSTAVGLILLSDEDVPTCLWAPPQLSKTPAVATQIQRYKTAFPKLQERWEKRYELWKVGREKYLTRGERPPLLAPLPLPKAEATNDFGSIWKTRIEPVIPYACRGVIWDQGDSGTGVPGVDQFTLVAGILAEWRSRLERKLHLLVVQKPVGGTCSAESATKNQVFRSEIYVDRTPYAKGAKPFQLDRPKVNSGNALLDEHYLQFEKLPDVALIPTRDLEPRAKVVNRVKLASRMIATAFNSVYHDGARFQLPQYERHEVDGRNVRVTFAGTRAGLSVQHAKQVYGFEVCGADHRWHWAGGEIVGRDAVVVSASEVDKPIAVRFGWAYERAWTNLFNSLDIPVQSFTTAQWRRSLVDRELPRLQINRLGQVELREYFWAMHLAQDQ
jgi:sialate O-acetylesterase